MLLGTTEASSSQAALLQHAELSGPVWLHHLPACRACNYGTYHCCLAACNYCRPGLAVVDVLEKQWQSL